MRCVILLEVSIRGWIRSGRLWYLNNYHLVLIDSKFANIKLAILGSQQ